MARRPPSAIATPLAISCGAPTHYRWSGGRSHAPHISRAAPRLAQVRRVVVRMIEYAYENFWTNTYAKFQLLTNGIVA